MAFKTSYFNNKKVFIFYPSERRDIIKLPPKNKNSNLRECEWQEEYDGVCQFLRHASKCLENRLLWI